jgi:Fe(3+) dicitrate transport protein
MTIYRNALAVVCFLVAAEAIADQHVLEEVTIIGSKEQAREMPGSAYVVSQKDLEVFNYSDINKILAQVPGVYLVPEEGFGLRPNIGIRGSGTDRSNKITLMEDGVLIAPAPYSNPDAYYFPSAGRMVGVEVLKGPVTLSEGPYTVGGAMNLLATPIPAESKGKVLVEVAENNENTIHANYGDSGDIYGFMLETYQHQGDGFKDIDRSSRDTGFDVSDYVGKFRLNTPASGDGPYQQLDLKVQYSEETSNSSYLGLTDVDFDADENRRYGLTDLDQMDNDHRGFSTHYVISVANNLDLKLLAYYNKYKRDWFKVDRIEGTGISGFIDDANAGDADAIGVLHGGVDVLNGIDIKHNNREYNSKGIQFSLDWEFDTFGMSNELTTGVRYHRDRMDRFQPVETYSQLNGSLVYGSTTEPTGSNNRKEKGEATAFWIVDAVTVTEQLDLTFSLRYEDIETKRKQWADTDRATLDDPEDQRKNDTDEWQPGLGMTYQFTDSWQLLAGVYRGIAPAGAGATDGTDPEKSNNYELGVRFTRDALYADVIGFYSDYDNSVRNCSVAHTCTINGLEVDSGTQQLGEADIKGVEVSASYSVDGLGMNWPMQLSYTYTDAQISKDSDNGDFLDGDNYQYMPENQFYASVGVVSPAGWDIYLAARYLDEMCVDFTCNRSGVDNTYLETDELWVFDLATHYQLTEYAQVYVKVDNLADEQKIVSRSPAGARPNQPRTASVGLSIDF